MSSTKFTLATTEWVSWVSSIPLQLLLMKDIFNKSASSIEVNYKAYVLASLEKQLSEQ